MKNILKLVGVFVTIAGTVSYYLGSFTIVGWIGIFMVAGGIVLLVKPWNRGNNGKGSSHL